MTISGFKKRWPKIIKKAERQVGKKFERRPVLKIQQRRGNLKSPSSAEFRRRARHPHVFLTRRLIREAPRGLSESCALHELRELLYLERGYSRRQAHLKAKAKDGKGTSWELRRFLKLRKGDGIVIRR